MNERAVTSFAISGDRGLLEEVSRAVAETLQRFDLKIEAERQLVPQTGRWDQDGGWYLVVDDPWSQSGGWVLDLEGRLTHSELGRPHALVVRDVWAALDRCSAGQDMDPWQQAWGPTPEPRPVVDPDGPGDPDPIRIKRGLKKK